MRCWEEKEILRPIRKDVEVLQILTHWRHLLGAEYVCLEEERMRNNTAVLDEEDPPMPQWVFPTKQTVLVRVIRTDEEGLTRWW